MSWSTPKEHPRLRQLMDGYLDGAILRPGLVKVISGTPHIPQPYTTKNTPRRRLLSTIGIEHTDIKKTKKK